MPDSNSGERFRALVLAALLVTSTFGVVPIVGGASGHTSPPPADQTFEATENVDVWERSFLPLRAQTEDAVETVPNADIRVRNSDGEETNIDRDPMPVYEDGESVTIDFDLSTANGNSGTFGGTDVEIIAAHIREDSDASVPDSFSDAIDLVTEENANSNATFEDVSVQSNTLDSSSGDLSFEYTPDKPGHYVIFVANEDGTGFDVSNGDISVQSQATIIGMEHLAVRKDDGSVSPDEDTVTPGEDITFDANPNLEGTDIKQTVAVYDEDTFTSSSFVHDIETEVTDDFSLADDSTLNTSITEVNGVARNQESLEAFGVSIESGSATGTIGVGSIVDFIGDRAGTEVPPVERISGSDTVLDASMTTINRTTADQELTVETFENWSTGSYRYVYLGAGDDSSEMAMDTGTITIESEADGPPARPPADDDDDDDAEPPAEPELSVSPGSLSFGNVLVGQSATESVTVTNTGDAPLDGSSVSVSGADAFSASLSESSIPAGESATATVTFEPTSAGPASGTLTVEGADQTANVDLSGTGLETDVAITPDEQDFGGVAVGNQTSAEFTVENTGSGPAQLGDLDITGEDSEAFSVTQGLAGTTLDPGASQTVTVQFAPTEGGTHTARLELTNASDVVVAASSLTGTGQAPDIAVRPETVRFEDATINETSTRSLTIENRGNAPLQVDGIQLAGQARDFDIDAEFPLTVAPGESQAVDVTFTPQRPGVRAVNAFVESNDPADPRVNVFLTNTRVELNVTSERQNNRTQVNARVTNAEANTSVPVPVSEGATSTADEVAVDSLSITPAQSGNFTADIATSQDRPAGAPSFESVEAAEPVDYVDVDTSLSNEEISNAQFEFRVNKSTLQARQSEPEDVQMYRGGPGGWEPRPTIMVNETPSEVVFQTNTTELSPWAVGVEQPQISVQSASADVTSVTTGESVTIDVTLVNDGGSDGTFTAELLVDGTAVDSTDVTVPAGGTETVTFERQFEEVGTYSVSVNDVSVADITVSQVTTPTPGSPTPGEPTDTPPSTPGEDGDGGGIILPLLLIIIVVVAAAFLVLRNRD